MQNEKHLIQSASSEFYLNYDATLQSNNFPKDHLINDDSHLNKYNTYAELETDHNVNLTRPKTTNSYKVSHLNTGETKKVHTTIKSDLSKSPPKY